MAKAKVTNVHRLEFLHRDRGYRFQDRDPQMIELCDLIDKSGMSVSQIIQTVVKATGGAYRVGRSTIDNWLNGKTRRPQNMTLSWVAYAIGYERRWIKIR
jgi:hypothetical protein